MIDWLRFNFIHELVHHLRKHHIRKDDIIYIGQDQHGTWYLIVKVV